MTGRAARKLAHCSDFVFRHKFLPDFFLIHGRFPFHVEDLVFGTHVLGGIAMAIEAPLHIESGRLKQQGHLVYLTVACGAADALVYVNAVIEIDVVSQAMHFHPFDGFIRAIAFADRFEVGGVIEEHGMAIHAGFRGRNAGVGGTFYAGMTVAAIDAIIPGVVFVAELNRLHANDALICRVG